MELIKPLDFRKITDPERHLSDDDTATWRYWIIEEQSKLHSFEDNENNE